MSVFMRLIFHRGPWAGQEIITAVPMLRIGSDPAVNDLVIDDPQLARAHCVIQRSSRGEYILEDLSQLGASMMINGKEFADLDTAIYLGVGDIFHLGSSEIEVGDASPRLVQTGGDRAGLEIHLGEELVSIGRAPDNTIEISDSETSIYHAVIRCTEMGLSLEDQRSTNGTYVNDTKISSHILQDGDRLRVGRQEYLFMAFELDEVHEAADDSLKNASAQLTFLSGPKRDETIDCDGSTITIGTSPDCNYVLVGMDIDSLHCRILPSNDLFYLENCTTSKRTLINNQPIGTEPKLLQNGDLVTIGSNIAEYKVLGGIPSTDGKSAMMTSIIAAGDYDISPQAKFVINGHIEAQPAIVIGTSPSCQLQLDGPEIEPLHCRISWQEGFIVEDTSVHGSYLDNKRVVKDILLDGAVLRIGKELINVSISGERCNLDVIDRQTALAAIEIQRETEFDLSQAQLDPANMGGAVSAAYKTVFKLNVTDVESLVRERKEKFHEGAPAWRPSTDIQRPHTVKIGILLTILASLGFMAFTYFGREVTPVLSNHPLSESHSSRLFSQTANEKGVPDDCRSCHSIGIGVSEKACLQCHEEFRGSIREEHVNTGQELPVGRVLPKNSCAACHKEHLATPRYVMGNPSVLNASKGCASVQCHPNQHQGDFSESSSLGKNRIEAGPIPSFDLPIEEFHIAHATIEKDDQDIAIACTTCHAKTDEATDALVEANPGRSCFGCHGGSSTASVSSQCLSCHGAEHGTEHGFERVAVNSPMMVAATLQASPSRSLFWAALIVFCILVPFLLFAILLRIRFQRANNLVVEKLSAHPIEAVKHLIHSLNEEKCVGCHACVQACPTNVLELVNHKSKIVNFDACIQCRACEKSCAFGALVMHDADKPPPATKTPDLDAGLQTPIAGMYLIGQAGGIAQVKNASNMGRTVIEAAVREGLQAGEGQRVGAQMDMLIVGSGPAGLSAAITCHQYGLQTLILEKQPEFAWTIRNYFHKGKEVMAEPHSVELVGYLPIWDTNREEILASWQTTIEQQQLQVQYRQNVTNIEKVGELFQVTTSDADGNPLQTFTAARVIIAVGGLGNPRKLGCSGDELDKVRSALVDPDEFQGKNILVVGGTDSAIEVALALCEANTVALSVRSAHIERAKPANRQRLQEAFDAGKIIPQFVTGVAGVTETEVVLEDRKSGEKTSYPNDYIFALIGGIPPTKWLEGLGVSYVMKPHNWSPPQTDAMFR